MGEKYAYLQIADDVQRRIDVGEITDRLPSQRQLADQYGAAFTTVRRALEILRGRGVIITHARGSFVKPGG